MQEKLNQIRELVESYKDRVSKILLDNGVEEDGEFNYDCDFDDQILITEAETECNVLLEVIDSLTDILEK